MHIPFKKSNEAAAAQANRLATTPEPTDSKPAGRLARAGAKLAPARVNIGIPGLKTLTRTLGPKGPAAAGVPEAETAVSSRPMSAQRHGATLRLHDRGMDQLFPVAHADSGQPTVPKTLAAMGTEAGFHEAVHAMFGAGAEGSALSERLLQTAPPQPEGATRFLTPLVLATALQSVGAKTPEQAHSLIDSAHRGEESPALFRLERALAATHAGTQALGHLRSVQEWPAQLGLMRDGLNLCSELERKGVRLERHGSVGEVLRDLVAVPDANIDAPIGGNDDAPLQLLTKALRHGHAQRLDVHEDVGQVASDRAAFVAWKKGGFVDSGKGTDFNNTIGRLHKFMTYVDRADHGPRTLGALASETKAYFGRAIGVGKSPLSPMRHGTMGGDLDLAHEEAAKVRQALNSALSAAVENLVDELGDPAVRNDPAKLNNRLTRAAVFDLWQKTGHTEHAVADVLERAGQLMSEAGAPMLPLNDKALTQSLHKFTRRASTVEGAPAIRIGVKALEAMGATRARRDAADDDPQAMRAEIQRLQAEPAGNALLQAMQKVRLAHLQAQRRHLVNDLVAEMQSVERGGTERKPLFKLSDIKALLRGTPREGPTSADAQHVMASLARAKGISISTFSDGASRGVGSFGALALHAGAAIGTPLVYPIAQAEAGKSATVTIGNYPTGGRLFIGTERSKSVALGVGAGWAAPPLLGGLVSAATLADVSARHGTSHAEGVAISTRNDAPGWQDKLPAVVDFLFSEARLQPGTGRAEDPAALWGRFSDRFGADPQVAVNWVAEKSANTSASAGAVAVARAKVGAQTNLGPVVAAGVSASRSRFERSAGAHGGDVPTAVRSHQVVASASASISQTPPFVPAAADAPIAGWGAGTPLVGATLQWDLAGGIGIARLGRTRDGLLNAAMCQREVLFRDSGTMVEYVNRTRTTWEEAMVSQDASGATDQAAARERVNKFVQEVAAGHSALSLYGEMVSLSPEVADKINGYEARLTTLLGEGDRSAASRTLTNAERTECNALQGEVRRLLKAEASWSPGALYSAEPNAVAHNTGLNFGLKVANQEQAQAIHVNALLLAKV